MPVNSGLSLSPPPRTLRKGHSSRRELMLCWEQGGGNAPWHLSPRGWHLCTPNAMSQCHPGKKLGQGGCVQPGKVLRVPTALFCTWWWRANSQEPLEGLPCSLTPWHRRWQSAHLHPRPQLQLSGVQRVKERIQGWLRRCQPESNHRSRQDQGTAVLPCPAACTTQSCHSPSPQAKPHHGQPGKSQCQPPEPSRCQSTPRANAVQHPRAGHGPGTCPHSLVTSLPPQPCGL